MAMDGLPDPELGPEYADVDLPAFARTCEALGHPCHCGAVRSPTPEPTSRPLPVVPPDPSPREWSPLAEGPPPPDPDTAEVRGPSPSDG
jgi:hypothetical protein